MVKIMNYLFPFYNLNKSSKIINEKIKKLNEEACYNYEFASNNEEVDEEILLNILRDTIENKKILEDKAKSTLIAITISSTLIINLLNFYQNIKDKFSILFALVGFACLLYMIIAGILSLYSIGEINTISIMFPEDYLLNSQDRRKQIADNIEYNYLNNLKRNNCMITSYNCMISSISLLLLIFIISIFVLGLEKKNNNEYQKFYDEIESIDNKIYVISDEISKINNDLIDVQQDISNFIKNEEIIKEQIKSVESNLNNATDAIFDLKNLLNKDLQQ